MVIKYEIKTDYTAGLFLQISNEQEELHFYFTNDIYRKLTVDSNIFNIIEKYINTLDKNRVNAIFDIYKESFYRSNITLLDNSPQTIYEMKMSIKRLIDLINIDEFENWLNYNSNEITFPIKISEEFIFDPDLSVTKEKTFVKREYVSLVTLLLTVRACFPLYNDYLNYNYQATPSQYLYATFLLFDNSYLINHPTYRKLEVYINEIQLSFGIDKSATKFDQYVLNKGFSSDDVNEVIIAEIFLNKLFFIDLTDQKSNIVSYVFQTIRAKSSPSVAEGDIIRAKKDSADKITDEISYFEDYRKSSTLAIGTIAEIQFSLNEIDKMVQCLKMEKYFNVDEYMENLQNMHLLINVNIDPNQVYLLGWFLSSYIDPRSLFYIEKNKLLELLIFAKVCLWNKGHHFVSLLMTSYRSNDNAQVFVQGKNSISKHLREKLNKHYNFFMQQDNKDNLIETAITTISTEITDYIWHPTAKTQEVLLCNQNKNPKVLMFPPKLPDTLVEFLLSVHED